MSSSVREMVAHPTTPPVRAHGAAPETPPRVVLEYYCDHCWLCCSSERLLRLHNRHRLHVTNVQRHGEGLRPLRVLSVRALYYPMDRDDIWDTIFELEAYGEIRHLPHDIWRGILLPRRHVSSMAAVRVAEHETTIVKFKMAPLSY